MYEHVIQAVFETPWAITEAKYRAICALIETRAAGLHIPQAEIDAVRAAAPAPSRPGGGAVAVIPVFGVLAQRLNLMSEMSGGTSTEMLAASLRQALADETVGSIVLNIDSPGGSVYGVAELADIVYSARGQKPVVAVANSLAASAAYWLASQADEVVVTPSGQAGSIGVFACHFDESGAYAQEGIVPTLISAGRYKTEGNAYEPLTDEARQSIQAEVNYYYDMFTAAVARGRGVKAAEVRAGFGEGRVVNARDAVRLGMADRVATLDDTIQRLVGGRRRGSLTAIAGDMSAPVAAADTLLVLSAETEQPITAKAVLSGEPETAREASDSGADLDRRRRRLRLLSHG